MNATPLLELTSVQKKFDNFTALKGVSLSVDAGSVTCIVGPSGSGKSTLLRTINLLERIDGGEIRLKGEEIGFVTHGNSRMPVKNSVARKQATNFGMVFQSFNLVPHMTARENVSFAPSTVLKYSTSDADARAISLLRRVGLGDRIDHYPSELSGGQQQRVAIARALAMDPTLMLFDEPTSALDAELVAEVLEVIRELAKEGMTMLIVTHELTFARDVADTLVMMDQGEIVEAGVPEQILHTPRSPRAKRFFASLSTNSSGAIAASPNDVSSGTG